MGKSKKKDPLKKAVLQAKKDAKADKKAQKRFKKASIKGDEPTTAEPDDKNQSLDDLLEVYRKKDVDGSKPIVDLLEGYPPPRGNFTMTAVEDQKGKLEVYIFGGEYFDGVENIVVDHLLKFTVNQKGDVEWKQISMPSSLPSPAARCAHSAVYYNGSLYVFGGELAATDYYHHYKDLWKYDIKSQTWQELVNRTGTAPSSRSGHSAIVWKHYMVVFGGFYEAARDTPRWFNDVFVFDLKAEQWMEVPHSKLGNRPEPRSACNIAVVGDDVVLHGGFSKLVNAAAATGKETKVHNDTWLLHLKPILQGKPPTWEKIISSSSLGAHVQNNRNPNGRSGTASTTYKDRMIVFGGVVDAELMHHKVDSCFFNDLFCLDVTPRPRWFPLHIRKPKTNVTNSCNDTGDKPFSADQASESCETQEEECEDDDSMSIEEEEESKDNIAQHEGWDNQKLRKNMFAFYDGSGNIVYERMGTGSSKQNNDNAVSDEEKEEEEDEEKCEESDGKTSSKNKKSVVTKSSKIVTTSSVMTLDPETNDPKAIQREDPLPRIKTAAIIHRNILYVYGGLVEIGDREVTLDDMWCLDLKKRDQWKCLWPGTMHKQVWRGALHDDDDSYISVGGDEEDESDSDDEDDSEEDDEEKTDDKHSGLKEEKTDELVELSAKYNLDNDLCTPRPGEALADFHSRTAAYWNERAGAALLGELSKKELKREGFQLARKRFDELQPILERLQQLDISGKSKSKSSTKKKSKK